MVRAKETGAEETHAPDCSSAPLHPENDADHLAQTLIYAALLFSPQLRWR